MYVVKQFDTNREDYEDIVIWLDENKIIHDWDILHRGGYVVERKITIYEEEYAMAFKLRWE